MGLPATRWRITSSSTEMTWICELEALTMHRRSLVDERVALGNRMVALLKCYFPTIIELNPANIHAKYVLSLLRCRFRLGIEQGLRFGRLAGC